MLAALFACLDQYCKPLHESEPMRTYALLCISGDQSAPLSDNQFIMMTYLDQAVTVEVTMVLTILEDS